MIVRYSRVVSVVGFIVLALVWTGCTPSGQARPQGSAAGKRAAGFDGLTPLATGFRAGFA